MEKRVWWKTEIKREWEIIINRIRTENLGTIKEIRRIKIIRIKREIETKRRKA